MASPVAPAATAKAIVPSFRYSTLLFQSMAAFALPTKARSASVFASNGVKGSRALAVAGDHTGEVKGSP